MGRLQHKRWVIGIDLSWPLKYVELDLITVEYLAILLGMSDLLLPDPANQSFELGGLIQFGISNHETINIDSGIYTILYFQLEILESLHFV